MEWEGKERERAKGRTRDARTDCVGGLDGLSQQRHRRASTAFKEARQHIDTKNSDCVIGVEVFGFHDTGIYEVAIFWHQESVYYRLRLDLKPAGGGSEVPCWLGGLSEIRNAVSTIGSHWHQGRALTQSETC